MTDGQTGRHVSTPYKAKFRESSFLVTSAVTFAAGKLRGKLLQCKFAHTALGILYDARCKVRRLRSNNSVAPSGESELLKDECAI